jgi:sugar phosphate isomerase/epimerase
VPDPQHQSSQGRQPDAADPGIYPDLVASFFTLSGAGFTDPPRNSFLERCEAAAAAGFAGIGLHADDLPRTLAAGLDVAQMQAILRHNGLRLVEIEFLGGWAVDAQDEHPETLLAPTLAGIEAVADAFGGRSVSTGEFSGTRRLDTEETLDRAAAGLRANAERLAHRGLLVALESFPWSAISNVDIAIDLLRRAGAPNAGLLIDIWHFYNGGATPEQLHDLPGAGIAAVQLNDGPLVHEDFLTHARAERHLPGHGDLEIVALIKAVQRTGYAGPYCVECNTPELRALPVHEAAHRAADTATRVLQSAGVHTSSPRA